MNRKNKKMLWLGLQFFAEGAGDGGATGEGAAANNAESVVADDDDVWMAEMEQKYGVSNGVASAQAVIAAQAKQSDALSEEAKEDPVPNHTDDGTDADDAKPDEVKTPEEEFDELIKTKYKGAFQKKMSDYAQKRWNDSQKSSTDKNNQTDATAEKDKYKSALSLLAGKYGKSPDDMDGIIAALQGDEDLLEDEAYKKGTTVAELKIEKQRSAEKAATDQEISRLKQLVADGERKEKARADADRWSREAKDTKKLYGDSFDLMKEIKNPEFMKYLKMEGMSVTDAFEHAHLKDIMASQLKAVERRADENAAKVVESNKTRPRESAAVRERSGDKPRIDLRNMTEDDYRRIDEMIARGEKVTADYFR